MAKTHDIAVSELGLGAGLRPVSTGERLAPALITAILLMLVIQTGLVVRGLAPVLDGVLIDPDGYMRLARVERLWETGAWYDSVFPRIDPPAGLELHWTRPLDVLLLAGAWLASPALGFEAGLFWWGVLLGPVLQVLSLLALVWAAAPLLRRRWLCLLAFLFVPLPGVFGVFVVGRPDHHGLLILLTILLIGLTIRLLHDPDRSADAVRAGLVAALALWVSVESLLVIAVGIAALGLFWLLGERRCLRLLFLHGLSVVLALTAVLLAERGASGFVAGDIDRVSGAHLTLFAINLAFWTALHRSERAGLLPAGLVRRALWSGAGGLAALTLLLLLQPGFFTDPLANGDELYRAKHLANIEELQPLIRLAAFREGPWLDAAVRPILWLGIAIPAAPWLFYRILVSLGAERRIWVFLGLCTLVFTPLAVAQLRWSPYPELVLLLPYAALAGTILDRLAARLPEVALGIVRPFLITALCVWFFVPSNLSDAGPQPSAAIKAASSCPIRSLAPLLNDPAGLGATPKRVLALIDFGPEILYRTAHSVLSIPNHRPQPGFAVGYRIMTTTDFAEARNLLRESGVDLVLICPGSAESWFYDTGEDGRTLYQALGAGTPPGFLEPVALPEDLSGDLMLFALRAAAG